MASRRVVLIDGTAIVYRAFFAIPNRLSTSSGLPTNAVFGFTTMFSKLQAGKTPDYAAVIFDPPGPTFRDERYPEYKAQRDAMPDDLQQQLTWIDKVVEAHNYPILRVPGFEADDVIGTLATEAAKRGDEVQIISGDKDFAQLITPTVRMIDTFRDINYDPDLVYRKWGVTPSQFVDFLALMGDKADNIPGVPGIGQKTAASLLSKYDSLDGIYKNLTDLKGKQLENLQNYKDAAYLSQDLATIRTDVPLDLSLDDLRHRPAQQSELNALYRDLEFYSLLSEEARDEQADDDAGSTTYRLLTPTDLPEYLSALPADPPTAIYPLFDPPYVTRGSFAGIAFSSEPRHAAYLPFQSSDTQHEGVLEALRAYLEDAGKPKVLHNAKELIILLKRHDINLAGVAGDTMLGSFLLGPQELVPHALEQVAKRYLHRTIRNAKSVLGAGQKAVPFTAIPAEDAMPYACHLADAVGETWALQAPLLAEEEQTQQLFSKDLPLSYVLAHMELRGVRVDPDNLQRMGSDFAERLLGFERRIYEYAGRKFNIQSTRQLGTILFEELGLPIVKRTKSGYSTNAEVLERLRAKHPIAEQILEYRKLAKLINTYTSVLQREINPATGRIHANFQQTVGVSGRLITTDPDLQRTPIRTPEGQRIREAFVPADGMTLISADWSQIELRVLAHFSEDPRLMEAFRSGADVHASTASEIFGTPLEDVTREQRDVGKTINFATIYGQGASALGQILGISKGEAKDYIDLFFNRYAGVQAWRDATIEAARESGRAFTLFGRYRVISELRSNSFMERSAGERIAVNTPIQGSAADLCKVAMVNIYRSLRDQGSGARLLLQIHDELVLESPQDELRDVMQLVRNHMTHVHDLRVPLVVDVGSGASWSEAH
jgi:DNA polymerase-1